ncbi:MAG: protein BatD [Flavobacteriales bacterium TMED84]|nr:MAG: protein BatD [Flavobacteriales bacterium TMED84]|tara:strand:- start:4584 stop:6305 length:1722 start_codon:yes stop_codon:yes gene_type:complete
MKKVLFLILISCNISFSQIIEVSVNKNPILVGESFAISFSFDKKANNIDFNLSNNEYVKFLSGPKKSSSSSITIVNGKRESILNTTFTYYFKAIKNGEFIIPSASITHKKDIIKSNEIRVQILNASNKQPSNSISNNLFVKAEISKKNVFVGEQLLVTYKLFNRYDLANTEITKLPNLDSFWKKDLETSSRFKREVINGVAYNVATIKKIVLTPQKDGTLLIDPIEIKCSIRTNNGNNDPFASFFNSYSVQEEFISSKPIKIKVKSLPRPIPENFIGIVGSLKVESSVDKSTVKANDAINYKISFIGTGNLELLAEQKIDFPTDFEVYDAKIDDRIFQGGLKRSVKTYEYLLIPRYEGKYEIPKSIFSYFDSKSEKFKQISTKAFKITVEKSEKFLQSSQTNSISKQLVSNNKKDIRHIKYDFNQNKKISNKSFNVIIFILVLVLILLKYFFKYIKNIYQKDTKSDKLSKIRIKKAEKYLKKNDLTKFYEEIEKSMLLFFSEKLNIEIGDFSKEKLEDLMKRKKYNTEIQNQILKIFNNIEITRYSPMSDYKKSNELLNECVLVIRKIESNRK